MLALSFVLLHHGNISTLRRIEKKERSLLNEILKAEKQMEKK